MERGYFKFVQVRVGNYDASTLPEPEGLIKMCANSLCHQAGDASGASDFVFTCGEIKVCLQMIESKFLGKGSDFFSSSESM